MYSVLEQRTKLYEDSSSIDQKVATFLKVVHEVDINGHRLLRSTCTLVLGTNTQRKGRIGTSLQLYDEALTWPIMNGNEILVATDDCLRIAGILYFVERLSKGQRICD
ncbi:MAG: hypothetical protein IPI30_09230 [Saprospiraceae bacterium]|nr:hypothetical protein [Candidatus Vicinibacter affinis]